MLLERRTVEQQEPCTGSATARLSSKSAAAWCDTAAATSKRRWTPSGPKSGRGSLTDGRKEEPRHDGRGSDSCQSGQAGTIEHNAKRRARHVWGRGMSDAKSITLALRGRWYGGYGLALCPAHDNTRTPALRLRDGRDGRLLTVCGAGCPFPEVASALRGLGLLEGRGAAFTPDPVAEAQRRDEEEAERRKRIGQARRAWAEAQPIEGTLAERYLRARGIRRPLPPSLQFHGKAWHGPTAKRFPAMVAAVTLEGEAEPVAVHRTYLTEPGRKADLGKEAKLSLGPIGQAAVRLSDGAGPLVVAEGIETALSLADAFAGLSPRVWAGLSRNGIAGLRLPVRAGELIVAPDGDDTGRQAAEELATRAHAAGWRVRILPPPGEGLDWNDAARGVAA
jgi:hypothetical protein